MGVTTALHAADHQCFLAPTQHTVGTNLDAEAESAATEPVHQWHTLKGTANATPRFAQSLYSDLVLVLRWLYAGEADARRCRDVDLLDCLCRDVALACLFGPNAVVHNALLSPMRVTLRAFPPVADCGMMLELTRLFVFHVCSGCRAGTLLKNKDHLSDEAKVLDSLPWVMLLLQSDPSVAQLGLPFDDQQAPIGQLNHTFRLMRYVVCAHGTIVRVW